MNHRTSTLAAAALGVVALLAPLAASSTATADTTARAGQAHQVKVAKAATQGFAHPGSATKDAGYGLLKDQDGIACIDMKGMGGMGVHYANPTLVGDGQIQLRHPEALVYRFVKNGHLRLSAVEYLVLKADWRTDHPTGRPELFGHRFNFTPAGNRFGLPAYFSLHAWIWYDNPAGTYQMFNPRVHCPTGV